ncbi:cytochrome c oxidase subunit II [Halobacteriales archaeon SW_12_69_24]|nr:MAG: cytochrome c oxidase subunit II [Halobacteriales archaeon SW_12_69_24]
MAVPPVGVAADVVLAGVGGIRAPAEVFQRIFLVFLGLGTLVGTVVISYTLYNAYKYRYREDADPRPDADRPELGEVPEGGGKGKKLFLSFGLSAVVVLSLVAWTYGALVMVEDGGVAQAEGDVDSIDVRVEGYQFGWEFIYPNGHVEDSQAGGKLYVPADTVVNLTVTSQDVHHNFGIPDLRIKSDAIPGQTTDAWFVAEETGTHTANCYELCGQGHSYMDAEVVVMEEAQFQDWYANTTGSETDATNSTEAAE